MYQIHEKVFEFCFDKYVSEGGIFKFALRKSNRYDRLVHGHWFYGDENYAAISFWSGSDWKNKTPNIFFGVDKNGWTFLELTASDSEKKHAFFKNEFPKLIPDLVPFKKGWRKYYTHYEDNYMQSLRSFIFSDKALIDTLVRYASNKYFQEEDSTFNRIGFIDSSDFEKRLRIVSHYRKNFDQKNIRKKLPERLNSLFLRQSFPSINISIENLPSNAQWIFFTGMNGVGKSNILRGITAGILDNYDNYYLINDPRFEVTITVTKNNSKSNRTVNLINQNPKIRKQLVKGFAAYGASRQTIMDFPEGANIDQEDIVKKSSMSYSLFNNDGYLFTIDPIFLNVVDNPLIKELRKGNSGNFSSFMHQIVELLPDIIPNLVTIKIPEKGSAVDLWSLIEYVEEDEQGNLFPPVTFENLSSGAKSLVAMFGDMLIRLFLKQPTVEDFSELTGIVLIDEIDVHLHPKTQRLIVERLTGIFPRVQFIVTTHSPIPLLGAPRGSVFYRVERTAEKGIAINRLNQLEKEIGNLLPNTIYTSDIFDLEDIVSVQNDNISEVDTSEDYRMYEEDNRLAKQIKRLEKNPDDEFLKFLRNEKS